MCKRPRQCPPLLRRRLGVESSSGGKCSAPGGPRLGSVAPENLTLHDGIPLNRQLLYK